MAVVTRFNPSCNGGLHLGHVYTMLVNEAYAHERGGKFYIRFDDSSPHDMLRGGPQRSMIEVRQRQLDDIEWLGIKFDAWYSQLEMRDGVERFWKEHGYAPHAYRFPVKIPYFLGKAPGFIAYPFQPCLIAERVVHEHMIGTTHMIRGDDLCTDYSLHCWLCDLWGLKTPEFIYLPRVESGGSDLSKTMGAKTIGHLRSEGYSPDQIMGILAKGCLRIEANGWTLENLSPNPRI